MRFNNLTDFRCEVYNRMMDMCTNLVIAVIREIYKNDKGEIIEDTKYKVYVTRDKRTGELNFFRESGIQMTWLTLINELKCPSYIDLISLTDIVDTNIIIY